MQITDIKILKVLNMHEGFHPKSSTQRLYTKQKERDRGATIQDETSKIQDYIKKMAPSDGALSKSVRHWTPDKWTQEEPSTEDKSLHGMYHQQISEVANMEKSYQRLVRAGLKDSTETLIMAAHLQALNARVIEARARMNMRSYRNTKA